MNTVDFILIVILGLFALSGLRFGLVHALGGLIGAIVSFFIAAKLYLPFAASKLGVLLGGDTNFGRIMSFIVIFVLLTRVIGIAVWLVDHIFKIATSMPGVGPLNRLAGLAFGLFEGVLLLAGTVYIAGKYPLAEPFAVSLRSSQVAISLNWLVKLVEPMLPVWLQQLKSIFDVPAAAVADYIRKYFQF